MDKQLGVHVVYRNEKLEPVYEMSYTLKEYTDMLRADLLRQITDVEDTLYAANGGKPKTEWPDASWRDFCRIKHKLLDKAGEIGRLPENIFEREDMDKRQSEFVAGVLNEKR